MVKLEDVDYSLHPNNILFEGNRKRNEQDVEAVTMFVSELLFFTIDSPDVLMRNAVAHHESITNTDKLTETEISEVTDWLIDIRSPIVRKPTAESIKDVVEWLTHARLIESSLTSRQLIITQKPMSLAKSIITSAYRHQFKDYDWGDESEFEVHSNQSAPSENPFKLITDGLIENRFVIITGSANLIEIHHQLIICRCTSLSSKENCFRLFYCRIKSME